MEGTLAYVFNTFHVVRGACIRGMASVRHVTHQRKLVIAEPFEYNNYADITITNGKVQTNCSIKATLCFVIGYLEDSFEILQSSANDVDEETGEPYYDQADITRQFGEIAALLIDLRRLSKQYTTMLSCVEETMHLSFDNIDDIGFEVVMRYYMKARRMMRKASVPQEPKMTTIIRRMHTWRLMGYTLYVRSGKAPSGWVEAKRSLIERVIDPFN
jgi:hypothetical protein